MKRVLLLCCLLSACNGPEHWPTDKFSAQAWQQSAPEERYKFAKDLDQSGFLQGKTRAEVIETLGKPDFASPDQTYINYVVRLGGVGLDQVFAIDVKFGPDGKVHGTSIRGD